VRNALRRLIMAPRFRIERANYPEGRQLLVDVSTIVRADVRTGIQRVVRALLGQLVNADIPGVTVQPIFASRNHGFCKAAFLADGRLVNASGHPKSLQPVEVGKDDIFLGLDLAAQILPAVEGQLAAWRHLGVSINMVVYDLLPSSQPDWFSPKLARNFRSWLGVVARQGDRCICISEAVAQALTQHLSAMNVSPLPVIQTIPLGSDLDASFPSLGLPDDTSSLLGWMQSGRTILTVGTIEPRKGHGKLLDAVDHIWRSDPGSDIALLVVGRAGWRTEQLQERIRSHSEKGKRLVWLDQASDEFLSKIYQTCSGLIAASHQEGFGLPLVEAAANGAPILARDIPVFREVGGSLFDYFDDDSPASLADKIAHWLDTARRPNPAEIAALPSWSDSAAALAILLGLTQPDGMTTP
jgi:glycosyltransferase involved in cell wall biosynthesis